MLDLVHSQHIVLVPSVDLFCLSSPFLALLLIAVSCGIPQWSAWKKQALYLSVNVFSTKVLIGDTIFYVSNWRRDRHFTWSYEPREGPAACSAKGVSSFLSYFKTLTIVPTPGIEPATSRSAVKRTTDWAKPAAVKNRKKCIFVSVFSPVGAPV